VAVVVRLRLEIADVPGALARAAAIIADHGGNITAVDVQHAADAVAVDEVTVEVGELTDLSKLRRALNDSRSVRVVALQSANPEDLVVRVLRRLTDVLAAPGHDPGLELRRAVAELCATPAVWVTTAAEASRSVAGRRAVVTPGEAVLVQTDERLPALADTVTGEAWLLAVAGRASAGEQRVVFVARPVKQRFSATEIGRIEATIALHNQVERLRAAPGAVVGVPT
jgi:hypothetical protein